MTSQNLAAQRSALREGALLLPAPHVGTLALTGADRQTWLNGMVTCDLAKLRKGDGAYGFAVAKNGKLLAELRVLVAEDSILLGITRDRVELIREHLDRHIIMEDATLEDTSESTSWLVAHGPSAPGLVAVAREVSAIAAAPVDMSGRGGAVLVLPPDQINAAIDRLCQYDRAPVVLGDDAAWDILRVEIGVPRWGVDFDDQNYPQEASLEQLGVSFQKGCYLGQEAVFMLQTRGHVKKRIVKLAIEGEGEIPPQSEINLPEGGAVGNIMSSAKNPDGPGVLALGYVKYKQAVEGVELSVAGRAGRVLGRLGA